MRADLGDEGRAGKVHFCGNLAEQGDQRLQRGSAGGRGREKAATRGL